VSDKEPNKRIRDNEAKSAQTKKHQAINGQVLARIQVEHDRGP
jgi:hypothetical protein